MLQITRNVHLIINKILQFCIAIIFHLWCFGNLNLFSGNQYNSFSLLKIDSEFTNPSMFTMPAASGPDNRYYPSPDIQEPSINGKHKTTAKQNIQIFFKVSFSSISFSNFRRYQDAVQIRKALSAVFSHMLYLPLSARHIRLQQASAAIHNIVWSN